MSGGADWHDPFSQDEEAAERERRRAERETRRRGRQGSLGEKVQAEQDTSGLQSAPRAAAATAAGAAGAAEAAGVVPTQPEAAPSASPVDDTHVAEPLPVSPEIPGGPPRQPPGGGIPPRRRGPGGLSPNALLVRRIVGVGIVLAVAALLVFGVTKVIDAISGDSESPFETPAAALKVEDVTIPEGLDRHQIGDVAKKVDLKGDYEEATKDFKGFDPAKYGADDPPNLEGFLFPATYELPKDGTVKDLVSRQLDAFKDNIAGVDLSYAKSKNLNVYDVLKIASMIEREVQVPKERELVAEVIYNRLKAGMNLGIDATIRYEDHNYDQQLTESRLLEDTPYNTRTHPGLPPTPIGNPGLASIEAAANPAKGDLLFFVVKPGTCGEHVFTSSEAEFEQAEAAYQQALQEQGGSPTEC